MTKTIAQPPDDALDKILEAERLGFDAVFTAETWGSDAFTPLAWWGSQTSRIRLGTSIAQLSARTPTATAGATVRWDRGVHHDVLLPVPSAGRRNDHLRTRPRRRTSKLAC